MPVLLKLQTSQFELSIWCNDIAKRQKVQRATLQKREVCPATTEHTGRSSILRFSPPLSLIEAEVMNEIIALPEAASDHIVFNVPLFFENIQYQLEWVFFEEVEDAFLTHRSHTLNEGFRFAKSIGTAQRSLPARLTGTISTGNNVGWMQLPLSYQLAGKIYQQKFAFEVLPTKMDLHSDLPAMYRSIDQTFPLWRFSLVEKTEQDATKSQHRGHFPLLWLANFGNLRRRFEDGLKVVAQAPHSRLQASVFHIKADRLKGKLPHRLAVKVKEDFACGSRDKRYRVEKKHLSVDTPENRFIKMAVIQCKKRLVEFEGKLRQNNKAPDTQRISDAFLNELRAWQKPLQKIHNKSFLKGVGAFNGLTRESLVLQQKTGYSGVYRVWQELKFYLDVFANQSSVSMKSVAEIYEVWCFLSIRDILINELGFCETHLPQSVLTLNEYFEYQLKNGFVGAFEFERDDGVRARLAHEPVFSKTGIEIRSFLVNQEPDIVLEITLPGPFDKRFVWLFDAKYRIKDKVNRFNEQKTDETDYVPDDAINQMHRYRDALIRITKDHLSSKGSKSRPTFGAYALYPGYFEQLSSKNPYSDAIDEIGIGAFALLPTSDGKSGNYWLTEFLREQIGGDSKRTSAYSVKSIQEQLYVQESARIPYYGMEQVLYPDLTMTVSVTGQKGRPSAYFSAFENGTAKWYHLPQKTFINKFKQHIASEIRFLALASTSENESASKRIDKLWPVNRVILVPRNTINEEQAGKVSLSVEPYYLFELGKPLGLKDIVCNVPHRPIRNSMKLTTLSLLEHAKTFSEVGKVYESAWLK